MASARVRFGGGLLIALLTACCGSSSTPTPRPTHRPTPSPTPTPAPTPPPDRAAPALVQIDNSPEARPQSGLASATTIYEYVAEGGISRFSALFTQPPPVRIGPVRSTRLATIELLRFYQGVLVYSGASTYILGQLRSSGLKNYSEDNAFGDLFRVRGRAAPHNLYTDGQRLSDLLRHAGAPNVAYQPPSLGPPAPAGAAPASALAGLAHPGNAATVPVSYRERPQFSWDAGAGGYIRHEPTGTVIDANTGSPVVSTTLIVQQVEVREAREVRDVVGEYGVRHTLSGTGSAQVFSGGSEYDATWTQPPLGPPQLTLANGLPAPIAAGLVWVCLVPTGSAALAS